MLKMMRVAAARSGKRDYQVVEKALRAYLGLELLEKVAARSSLSETERSILRMRNCIKAGYRTGGFRSRRIYRGLNLRDGRHGYWLKLATATLSSLSRPRCYWSSSACCCAQVPSVRNRARGPRIRRVAAAVRNGRWGSTAHHWPHAGPRR